MSPSALGVGLQASSVPLVGTFGKTTVGASSDSFAADRKRVNRYTLPVAGAVSELSVYLAPTSTSGQQLLKGVVYADSGGAPGKLLGASAQLTFASASAAGWYHLAFAAPLQLVAGEYWIGVLTGAAKYVAGYRYDSVTGVRDYNANTYTSGPTDPFGSFTSDNQQMSLYATYTPAGPPPRPVNSGVPTISGLAQTGQQLTASPGSWSNSPTSYEYGWQRCDAQGANCESAGVSTSTYTLASGDLNRTLRVSVTAINGGGASAAPAASAPTAVVTAPSPPVNSALPAIIGTPQAGQTLIAGPGTWSGSPTGFTYQWQRCDEHGEKCESILTATSPSYGVVPADVNSTLRVSVIASNGVGPSASATSAPSAVVGAAPSVQQFGKTTVGASSDSFAADRKRVNRYTLPVAGAVSELSVYLAPTSTSGQQLLKGVVYADSGGAPGKLLGASAQLTFASASAAGWYHLAFAAPLQLVAGEYWIGVLTGAAKYVAGYRYDSVTGVRDYNANTYTSGPTDPFGSFTSDNQQMSLYATYTPAGPPPRPVNSGVPTISGLAQTGQQLTASPGSWSNSPTSYEYGWQRCDAQGANCESAGVSTSTYTLASGDLNRTLRVSVTAINGGGASAAPAASAPTAVVTAPSPPVNSALPAIIGTPQAGQTLIAGPGTWSGSPTGFTYQWQRCDEHGEKCESILTATSPSYGVVPADVNSTLRVSVIASNGVGPSASATSAPSAVVGAAPSVQHLEYVFGFNAIYVYNREEGFKLDKTIAFSQGQRGIRGLMAYPPAHMLYVAYGGDGGGNGGGSVLAYNLVTEKIEWTVNVSAGIDSGVVSPDGKLLYIPTGENNSSGIWNILSTENGAIVGTIQGGANAHNTVISKDGRYVYLAGRNYNYLDVYETATGKVIRSIGPMVNGVRPFTVDGSNTLSFTTATHFDGFQVASITTGKVLYTISFGPVPPNLPDTAPSHGVSLSPNEKELYVVDDVNKEVQVWNVAGVSEGVAPTRIGVIPVAGLEGSITPCAYDCQRGGWLQRSLDGRFLYVGDSGSVIETATGNVVTDIRTLYDTKLSIEIDWAGGVPVATSGRTGIGVVE